MTRHWQLENYMLSLHYLLVRSWRVWLQQMAALTMQAELGLQCPDGLIPPIFAKTPEIGKTPYRATVFLSPISMVILLTGMLDQVVTFSIFPVNVYKRTDHDVPVSGKCIP